MRNPYGGCDQSPPPPLKSPPFLTVAHPFGKPINRHPLFDVVHTLRGMNVISQGITLPTIVVIGDQSSGKSSLIESLTGIGLPERTRIPLIMKIQHHSDPDPKLHLHYQDESLRVYPSGVSSSIKELTQTLAGYYGVKNVPLTLVVAQKGVTDITIVDLPGIPIGHSQKVTDIIETYIKQEDCVILNVISATTDFLACESIKIAKKFDKDGERTLHVITKVDQASKRMVEIVTTSYTGPDFVCVSNRIGKETYEDTRAREAKLLESQHLLSKIDESMFGVRALAQKLLLMQLNGNSNFLYGLVGDIDEDINTCIIEQNRLEQHNFTTVSEAMPVLIQIINMSKKSLSKIIISHEFDEFPDDPTQMHCYTKLIEMSNEFSQQLMNNFQLEEENEEFLLLEERKWYCQEQVSHLFQIKVDNMLVLTNTFVSRIWDYIEGVMIKVMVMHAEKLRAPRLVVSLRKATRNVIAREKESFKGRLLIMMHKSSVELDLPSVVHTMVENEMETQLLNELKSMNVTLKDSPSMTRKRWKLKNRIELLGELKKVIQNEMDEISFQSY